MCELKDILFWFPPPDSTHSFLLGSELFSSYSANSSLRPSLITTKSTPTSPQTPGYPAEVSGRAKELGKKLGKQWTKFSQLSDQLWRQPCAQLILDCWQSPQDRSYQHFAQSLWASAVLFPAMWLKDRPPSPPPAATCSPASKSLQGSGE